MVVQYLTDYGADVKAMNIGGLTPLHFAVALGQLNTVVHLIAIDTNETVMNTNFSSDQNDTCNDDVMAALQLAISYGHADIVQDLIWKFCNCTNV
jgi:ankyrin repeat protein